MRYRPFFPVAVAQGRVRGTVYCRVGKENGVVSGLRALADIRIKLAAGEYEFSRHALRRVVERNITEREIEESGANAEILELYPDDKYSPSALLLGYTSGGRPLHLQVTLGMIDRVKIITVYEPEPEEWIDHRKRR